MHRRIAQMATQRLHPNVARGRGCGTDWVGGLRLEDIVISAACGWACRSQSRAAERRMGAIWFVALLCKPIDGETTAFLGKTYLATVLMQAQTVTRPRSDSYPLTVIFLTKIFTMLEAPLALV